MEGLGEILYKLTDVIGSRNDDVEIDEAVFATVDIYKFEDLERCLSKYIQELKMNDSSNKLHLQNCEANIFKSCIKTA